MSTDTEDTPPADHSTIPTPEQAQEYEEALKRFHSANAAATLRARQDKLAPLAVIVGSPAYATLLADLTRVHLTGAFLAETTIDAHLRAALSVLPALRDATAQS